MKWAELIEPAIKLADEGFILDEALPTTIAEGRGYLEKYAEAARIYLPGGKIPRPGDRFVNKDYAATLRAIAKDGADTFYRGEIARKIAADLEDQGGIITYADLAQYRAIEREPVVGQYRGHALYAGGPPVATGIQMFESLQILENYQPRPGARATTDPDYFHYLIEAWKVRDQIRRVADPERWPVDFAEHLTVEHAKKRFAGIDPRKASLLERQTPDDAPAGAATAHRHGDDVVCRRRCRRQHDRRHADAQHVGRNVLRVEGAGFPLQQPPAIVADDGGRLRQHGAADAVEHGQRADAGVCEDAQRGSAEARGRAAPAMRGSRCRSTT